MGDYIDLADLEDAFSAETILDLSDLDNDDTPDAGVVDKAITNAETLVNSHATKQATLASLIANPPDLLIQISLDLGLYELAKARDQSNIEEGTYYNTLYKNNMALLKAIAKGDISLGIDPTTVTSKSKNSLAGNTRRFNDTTLAGY